MPISCFPNSECWTDSERARDRSFLNGEKEMGNSVCLPLFEHSFRRTRKQIRCMGFFVMYWTCRQCICQISHLSVRIDGNGQISHFPSVEWHPIPTIDWMLAHDYLNQIHIQALCNWNPNTNKWIFLIFCWNLSLSHRYSNVLVVTM